MVRVRRRCVHIRCGKYRLQEFSYERRCVHALRRALYNGAVSRGNCRYKGRNTQIKGIVPRSQNQHHAVGLPVHIVLCREACETAPHSFCSRPDSQILTRFPELPVDQGELRHIGLRPRFREIQSERRKDGILLFANLRFQAFQHRKPKRKGFCSVPIKIYPLGGNPFCQASHAPPPFFLRTISYRYHLIPNRVLALLTLILKACLSYDFSFPRIACSGVVVEDVLSTTIIRLPKGDDTANAKIKRLFYAA